MFQRCYLGLFVLLFILCGCATIYNPATQRQEYIFIPPSQEVQIGRSMSENIIKEKYGLLKDPARQLFVSKVGNRIARVCDRRDIVYHFMVLDSPDLNAFALPGGYVYIYKGLLDKVDEPELAAILAHEVAHIAARHSVKKMQASLGYNLLMGLVLVGIGDKDSQLFQQMSTVSDTVFTLLTRGYSRKDELLADNLAVKYLRQAGYDPYAMAEVLEILANEKGPGGRVFEVLSTHPRMQERIKKAREEVEAQVN